MRNKIYVFPNLENELIRTLKEALAKTADPIAQDVYVGTRKRPADYPNPEQKQITVRSDGGEIFDYVLKSEGFGINIWAEDFQTANTLASIIESLLPAIPIITKSQMIKIEIDLSPTRVNEAGTQEQRYLTGTVLVKARSLTLT